MPYDEKNEEGFYLGEPCGASDPQKCEAVEYFGLPCGPCVKKLKEAARPSEEQE